MGVLSDIIGGIGSVLGFGGQAMANKAQARENEKNRQFSLDMWNRENEYNLPENVMARYTNAGLNPNLVYGANGGVLSAHAQTPSTDNNFANPFGRGLSDYFQAKNFEVQREIADSSIDVNKATVNEKEQNAVKAEQEALLASSNKEKVDWENIITSQTYENTIQSSLENLEILKNNHLITEEQYKIKQQEFQQELEHVREARAKADLAEEAVHTQQAVTSETLANTELLKAKKVTELTAQEMNKAIAMANRADAGYKKKLGSLIPYERNKLMAETRVALRDIVVKDSQIDLNDANTAKVWNDIEEQWVNGNFDRAIRSMQKFGLGNYGTIANIADYFAKRIKDQTVIGGTQRGAYYVPKNRNKSNKSKSKRR